LKIYVRSGLEYICQGVTYAGLVLWELLGHLVYVLNLGLQTVLTYLERCRVPTQHPADHTSGDSTDLTNSKYPETEPDTGTEDDEYISDSEYTEEVVQSKTKKNRYFDDQEDRVLKDLCTQDQSPEDYRYHRGARGCNINLTRNFNTRMGQLRKDYVPFTVAQIAGHVNGPAFQKFLNAAQIPQRRAPTQRWGPDELAILQNALLVQEARTPQEVQVTSSGLVMTPTFERLLVAAVQARGLQRGLRAILKKAQDLGKQLYEQRRRRGN
jgi:hypothetical protein